MKLWKELLLGLTGLSALIILAGWFLPANQRIERIIVARGKPMIRFAAIRRMLAIMLLALWWGGFPFYAGRGVCIGPEVLRGKVRQGFITERVTSIGVPSRVVEFCVVLVIQVRRACYALLAGQFSAEAIEVVLAFGLAALLFLVTEELLVEAHQELVPHWDAGMKPLFS